MPLPPDYAERVYAGVLGKIIGVYLGRPFEGWTYDQIMAKLGEITYYVHDRQEVGLKNNTLVVTDDDISGTFSFLRALPDYANTADLTPAQIGQTWLNYIIEQRTVLWWGGRGVSTEHTAYLNLKHGIQAPDSGSIARNGRIVAEQIGSQIFIDGWAMVCPGDPERAADLARRAASVSHDGEAIYGAQVIAAMEAQAFVEPDLDALLSTAIRFIPPDSVINRLIHDVRNWAVQDEDWHATRERIVANYGYDKYGGNCHMVPNHAVIMLGLLYGENDFQRALMITNTAGWDTDCNSGNVGCLLGIKNGLAGLETGPDWRGPVADQMFMPTADGGRTITDAVRETYAIVNSGRALAGAEPHAPKNGARFHFDLPGAVQGFRPEDSSGARGTLSLENVAGHSRNGARSLALHYHGVATGRTARAATPTFIPPGTPKMDTYNLIASPTVSSGQTVRARVRADLNNAASVTCGLYLQIYGADDQAVRVDGPAIPLAPGAEHEFVWVVPATHGAPICAVGVALAAAQRADGTVYLDMLTWDGEPDLTLTRPAYGGEMWRRAWVNGVDQWEPRWPPSFRIVQNEGTGLLIYGTREWCDYTVSAAITPSLAAQAGIAARVQGMRRYYALLLVPGGVQLIKALDGETTLAEADLAWAFDETHTLQLAVVGSKISAWVDGRLLFSVADDVRPLDGGGVALVVSAGCMTTDAVTVQPIPS